MPVMVVVLLQEIFRHLLYVQCDMVFKLEVQMLPHCRCTYDLDLSSKKPLGISFSTLNPGLTPTRHVVPKLVIEKRTLALHVLNDH